MSKRIVFYVDDDPDDQQLFTDCVEAIANDFECIIANDGVNAIQLLQKMEVDPSCIFIDMNMPILNGRQFLALVKSDSRFRHIPCFIFSTSRHGSEFANVMALGAEDYLTKPSVFKDYCNLVHGILDKVTKK